MGDCFFRCVAAHLSQATKPLTKEQAQKDGSWLRLQTIQHVFSPKHRQKFSDLFATVQEFESCLSKAGELTTYAQGTPAGSSSRPTTTPTATANVGVDANLANDGPEVGLTASARPLPALRQSQPPTHSTTEQPLPATTRPAGPEGPNVREGPQRRKDLCGKRAGFDLPTTELHLIISAPSSINRP